MRAIALLAIAALFVSAAASAAPWKEYSYSRDGFAAQFPAEPKLETHPYKTALGNAVTERVYSYNEGGVVYLVGIADFSNTNADKDRTIDEAANALIAQGKLTHDETARVDGNYGREIRVEDRSGTSYTDAIFFVDHDLYQIKVVYPAVNDDPAGSSGIGLFQTAFRFLR